jgi:leucine dehydrogenase
VAFEDLLRGWDGREVCLRFDEPSGTWMFICVHNTVLGPGMGGTRMKAYTTPQEALHDGLRLAAAMTLKQAAAGLPYGGGKAVLAVPQIPERGSPERRDLLLRYADLVDGLGGTYVTAADMNTSAPDMDVIGERTTHVLGRSVAHGGSGDPGRGTAVGVFHGIRASVRRAFGDAELAGRTVLIQGVGSVGDPLARMLHDAGATLSLSDIDAARARALAAELSGAQTVPAGDVVGAACDVFAPCAGGGVLSAETIPRLACRVVAGSANNQLATAADGERLAAAGILYAPDYVINAGGVIHLAGYETLGWDDARMAARLAGIGATLDEVFEAADSQGISTAEAADRLARERIEAGL